MPRSLFSACDLRDDIRSGGIDDGQFAADLRALLDPGYGSSAYAEAESYFSITYPTAGLKQLLSTAAAKLAAGGSAGLVVLSTTLGGGKTHSVMALYHLAKGFRSPELGEFVDLAAWPPAPVPVAAVIGDMVDSLAGTEIDGHAVHTLWGAMAAQLGEDAWAKVARHDETRTTPASSLLSSVFGSAPAVVIIDELASYLRAAGTSQDESTRRLAEATPAFLKSLLELATSPTSKVFVVLTEATGDLFSDESGEIRRVYSEVLDAVSRISTAKGTINPAEGGEIAQILKRRLLSSIDEAAAKETALAYQAWYGSLSTSYPLTGEITADRYAEEIERSYPFHPALIRALDTGLSSSTKFQRTRGALKILGDTLAYLKVARPELDILNTGDLHFADEDGTLEHLTSQLDRKDFVAIAKADFVGQESHAALIDAQRSSTLATRFATAAFLFSLPVQDLGQSFEDLALNVVHLEESVAQLRQIVDEGLLRRCWYLVQLDGRYVFRTDPNFNRVVDGAIGGVKDYEVTSAEAEYIAKVFGGMSSSRMTVVPGGADPAEVADSEKPTLVVFRPDIVCASEGEQAIHVRILDFRDNAGSKARRYKNTLAFFAAGLDDKRSTFRSSLRRHVALHRLAANPPTGFPAAVIEQIRNEAAAQQLRVAVDFLHWFNRLYFFAVGTGDIVLRSIQLSESNFTAAEKARSIDEPLVSRRLVEGIQQELANSKWRDRLSVQDLNSLSQLGQGKRPTTKVIYEYFLMDFRQPLPSSASALLPGIQGLVSQGRYVAYDKATESYLKPSEASRVTITDTFELVDPNDVPAAIPAPEPPPKPGPPPGPPGKTPPVRFSNASMSPSAAADQVAASLEASVGKKLRVRLQEKLDKAPRTAAWTVLISQNAKVFEDASIMVHQQDQSGAELRVTLQAGTAEEFKRANALISEFAKREVKTQGQVQVGFVITGAAPVGFVESVKLLETMEIPTIGVVLEEIQ